MTKHKSKFPIKKKKKVKVKNFVGERRTEGIERVRTAMEDR